MATMFIRTLIILLFVSSAYSQSIDNYSNKCKKSSFEKIAYTELAVVGVAVSDVILYPIAERSNLKDFYRSFQGALQLAVSYILYKELDWKSAVSFNLQMLTGVNDAIYYMFNPKEFKDTHFNHLNYTPFYLLNGGRLSKNDFKVQAGMGFVFGININF